MTTAERFMVEEFDVRYKDRCQLRVALRGYPEFEELKSVRNFTAIDKVRYMRIVRFMDEYTAYRRAANAGLVPPLDFDGDDAYVVPPYINRAYLSIPAAVLC